MKQFRIRIKIKETTYKNHIKIYTYYLYFPCYIFKEPINYKYERSGMIINITYVFCGIDDPTRLPYLYKNRLNKYSQILY